MKKIISCLLSFVLVLQLCGTVLFRALADETNEYSTCYVKFVLDDSTQYIKTIIKDECLMVNAQWLSGSLGLEYKTKSDIFNSAADLGNTLMSPITDKYNYFAEKFGVDDVTIFKNDVERFTISKRDSSLKFTFEVGKSTAAATSRAYGKMSVDLGTDVTAIEDEEGNKQYYVPLFMVCNIFNVVYYIEPQDEGNCIILTEPQLTVVDIIHMQDKLSEYKMQNCLLDAINDDLLSFLGMALGESLSNTIDSIVSLKLANLVDPIKDNYDVLALQMCSSDIDEVDKIAAQNDRLDFFYSASTEVYGSLIEAAQEYSGNKQPLIVKDEYRWSLSAWEKTKIKYDNVCNLGKVADISETINKYIGLGAPMIFNGLSLIFETASVQDKYLKFMDKYFEYADKTLSKEEEMGYNYIQDRMKIYESSFDDAWILLSNSDMLSNITTFAAEELTGLQLGKLGLATTAGKWGVNKITGGAFDFNEIYYNCMINQEFQKSSQKVVSSYLNEADFDLDTYRAIEWTRLKSYYVANENGLELYNQYYEISKFNADHNPTLNMLYDVGFGKKEKYSDAELEEFAKKVFEFAEELTEHEICKKFGIEMDFMRRINLNEIIIPEAAFEDYNITIGSKTILDSESKKINSDTEKLAKYMAVLLYGVEGTTPEYIALCEEYAQSDNEYVIENNNALFQSVDCKVVDAEDRKPIGGAEVTFISNKKETVVCTTDDEGNVLGLDETISNSFADYINGNMNTQGSLEENYPEKHDSAFSQYEPDIKYSTVELYLPVGTYSLDIKVSGYKDYKHKDKIKVKFGEKCDIGEILLELENIEWYLEPSIEADDINVLNVVRESGNYGEYIKSDCFVIKENNKFGLINIDGEVLIEPDYKYAYGDLNDHITFISDDHIINIIYCTRNRVSVYPDSIICKSCQNQFQPTTSYESNYVFDVDKGLLAQVGGAWDVFSDQFTFFGQNGYGIISPKEILTARSADFPDDIENIDNSSYNSIMGMVKDKYGVVKDGTVVLDFEYEAATSYIDGVAALSQNGKWGYVNSKGEIIIPFEYDAELDANNSYSTVEQVILPYLSSEGYIALSKENGAGYYDIKGNEVIPVGTFEKARPVYNGKAWVKDKKTGLWGIIKLSKNDDLDILVEKARTIYKENGGIESVYAIVELDKELCLIEGQRLDLDSFYNVYNSKTELITSHSSTPLKLNYDNDEYSLYAPFSAGGPIFTDAVYPDDIDSYIFYPNDIDAHLKEVKWDGYVELNDKEYEGFEEQSIYLENMHKIQYFHDGICDYIEFESAVDIENTVTNEQLPLFTGLVITKDDPLNVRNLPSTNAKIIGKIEKGSTVEVYSELDGWCEIRYNGQVGYVSKEFISCEVGGYAKPVIYLYPEEKTDVSVKIDFECGGFTCTYPEYDEGWNVIAYPDGKIINKSDNDEYSYLYWEGEGKIQYDFSSGFIVKREDTVEFLKEKLAYIGLEPKEYNEFIVYWLPIMQKNKYNMISFQMTNYTESAKLEVTPKPESMLRVFMAFKKCSENDVIPEQKLSKFNRNGFTVVEWGGTEVT